MDSAWKEIQPKNIFQLYKSLPNTNLADEALLYLYQPIMGAQALTLYLTMVSEIETATGHSQEALHAELLTMINAGIPQFFEARIKLEGIGLLETYKKEDPELGTTFLYKLLTPMEPVEFFKDTVLSFHLLNTVGEKKFQTLVKRFEPKPLDVDLREYQSITKKFLDVYGWQNQELLEKSLELEKVAQRFQSTEAKKTLANEVEQLNWSFVEELLIRKLGRKLTLDKSTKELFTVYHAMYGVDELELVEMSLPSFDMLSGAFNQKELQRLLTVANLPNSQKQAPEKAETGDSDAQTRRWNTLRQEGFSEKELQLVQESESIPPMIYLEAIKTQKNGYVSKDETWLIRELINESPLKNSVINILINYVLVVKNDSSLTRNFVSRIANDWSQLKIQSSEAAIRHVKTLKEDAKKKSETTPRRTSQKRVRREKLPEWLNKPQVEAATDPEKQAEINRKLQNYLAKKEGED
ncbi:replication initiation and membrane attachment protein [Enterococcus sp. AZ194]|uniref:replication initiation and membrane attachment family protein n=1 Tax=Enterococcus sp. AZ194 TaxID=2774629 RepID=UPI003F24F8EE